MKKWTVLLIIILALLVSGCGIMTPNNEMKKPVANEQKVVDIMYKFFSVISAENFGRAKSLCIKDSEVYDILSEVQDIFKDFNFPHYWDWNIDTIIVSIDGKIATVLLDISGIAVPDGNPIAFVIEDATCYLQKVGKWRIYGQVDLFLPYP